MFTQPIPPVYPPPPTHTHTHLDDDFLVGKHNVNNKAVDALLNLHTLKQLHFLQLQPQTCAIHSKNRQSETTTPASPATPTQAIYPQPSSQSKTRTREMGHFTNHCNDVAVQLGNNDRLIANFCLSILTLQREHGHEESSELTHTR